MELKQVGPNGQANVEKSAIKNQDTNWTVSADTRTGGGQVRLKRIGKTKQFLVISWPGKSPALIASIQGIKTVTMVE